MATRSSLPPPYDESLDEENTGAYPPAFLGEGTGGAGLAPEGLRRGAGAGGCLLKEGGADLTVERGGGVGLLGGGGPPTLGGV